ncbi:MAG: B12-binding domain-containing radical SAM protein [Alphaproteobacteria bacterium]|nr:B12-binding domain-containing radical SAM protein [Alphaproteobacteria bacterium]
MTISVGLAQINNGFSGQQYLPLAVGLLEAYAKRHAALPDRYDFLPHIFSRIPLDEAVAAFDKADVVGFSIYVWNANISLAIAKRLKELRPERLTVLGGPQVPTEPEDFLRSHPWIDVVVHGEGERTFLQLLEAYPSRDWQKISGISYIDGDGVFHQPPLATRITDLDDIPSPYLEGVFDGLMAAHPDQTWLAMWETNRGCPFSCTFCDWGSATATKVATFPMERVKAELDWMADRKIEFVLCSDANFGILPRDVEIASYAAQVRGRTGYPMALSVQNTKNATERAYATQKILVDAGLSKGVTISVQSVDAQTLDNIKRKNITLQSFEELQRRFVGQGVITYTDFILGLPGETVDSFMDGVSRLIENGQHNRIQFNNLSILPNAEMGDPAYIHRFGLETVPTPIVNMHGVLDDPPDGIHEQQQLVIATASMPPADWRKVRVFAFVAALLHFDKLLQLALMVMNREEGLSYRTLFEAFANESGKNRPLLGNIARFFNSEALRVQKGGAEMIYRADWLNIYWPADEHVFIDLAQNGHLIQFYAEAQDLLLGLCAKEGTRAKIIQAIALNQALLKQPGPLSDFEIDLDFDLPGFHARTLRGETAEIEHRPMRYKIARSAHCWADWDTWMQEVVWYGHRKGAYLYDGAPIEPAIAGHY